MDSAFRGDGAFVPIAEWIRDGVAVVIQTHVIDSPSVNSDGGDAFGRDARAQAQPRLNAFENCSDVPTNAGRSDDRSVAEAMHDVGIRSPVKETEQRYTTTLRA